jgi:osmotically-inducible protein OsmY
MRAPRTSRLCILGCSLALAALASACAAFAAPSASDVRITTEVKQRLAQYPELQAPNSLDVQTLHRVVYLRGLMGSPFEISLASSVASQVVGVRRVENLIGLENAK